MPSKALLIGTASEFSVVEINHFDHRLIWQLVQKFAPKSSLEQDANRKTPAYQKWEAQAQKFRDELTAPFLVSDHWIMNVLGWGAVLFSILSLTAIFKGEPGFWLWLGASLFFFGVGVFMILCTGTFQIGKEEIIRSSKLGNYRIQWNEITFIEYDLYGSIVLNGRDKYLTIYSPEWWASKDRIAADFLFSEMQLCNIEMKQIRVSFKMSKNTKFRKSSTENNE